MMNANKNIIEKLVREFTAELDSFAHNGILRNIADEKVNAIIGHYTDQCPVRFRPELIARIKTAMFLKWNYSRLETLVSLSDSCEKNIKYSIAEQSKLLLEKSRQWIIGFLNTGLVNSFRIVRTYFEPAVANTLLTYSLVVQPHLATITLSENKINHAQKKQAETFTAVIETVNDKYADLKKISEYSDQILNNLIVSESLKESNKPKLPMGNSGILKTDRENAITGQPIRAWRLNYSRRIMEPVTRLAHVSRHSAVKDEQLILPTEQRPAKEIQSVMAKYEYRIANCFGQKKNIEGQPMYKIPVSFGIKPSGSICDIRFLSNTVNKEIAGRMMIQLRQMQFSKIDPKLGDQKVYHTFFY